MRIAGFRDSLSVRFSSVFLTSHVIGTAEEVTESDDPQNSESSQDNKKPAPRSADYVKGRKHRILSYPVLVSIFALFFIAIALPIILQVIAAVIMAVSLGIMSGAGTGNGPVSRALDGQPRLLYGAIDRSGKVVVPCSYLSLGDFHDGLAKTTGTPWHQGDKMNDRKYGYLSKSNETIASEKYDDATDFSEGMAAVRGNKFDSWGYIDRQGKLIIPQTYTKAEPLKNGLATVETNLQYMQLDKNGGVRKTHLSNANLVDEGVSHAPGVESYACDNGKYNDRVFRDGLATASNNGKWGFVDATSWKIRAQFDDVQPFREGLAPVKIGNKWGFIDLSGEMKIPPQFQDVGRFSEGLAMFQENFLWGFIDKSGNKVIAATYSGAGDFAQGLAGIENEQCRWGYVSRDAKIVVPMQYDEVRPFCEDRGVVALNVPLLEKLNVEKQNAGK